MSLGDNTHVFIMRIWREPREVEGAEPEWRGVVEYLATGDKSYFNSLDTLLAFLVEKSGAQMQARSAQRPRQPLHWLRRLQARLRSRK